MKTSERLTKLFGDERDEDGKIKASNEPPALSPEELRRQKDQILADLKREYAEAKARWGGDDEYDGWFAGPLNNAHLNSIAAYFDLLPAFQHLLQINGGDMEKFYNAVEILARQPKKERQQQLRALGQSAVQGTEIVRGSNNRE
jgi:predicted aminopeptidase